MRRLCLSPRARAVGRSFAAKRGFRKRKLFGARFPRFSARAQRVFTVSLFAIALPLYCLAGLLPNLPAEAANYPILEIPDISLETPVQPLELIDHQLEAPATIAGAYSQNPGKILIIGHSSTVFRTLNQLTVGAHFAYDGQNYQVIRAETLEKSAIDMRVILAATPVPTVVIMTCAGTSLPNQDATHRLIITAIQEETTY